MTIAQKIREYRYAKGWGPDELASRADISRTALYQIESGKTELPRASTLQRIAVALDVPMDALLDHEALFSVPHNPERGGHAGDDSGGHRSSGHSGFDAGGRQPGRGAGEEDFGPIRISASRQRELLKMFADVLDSPLGEGVARIVEESYRMSRRGAS